MNLQDLMSKLKSIDESAMPPMAPTKDNEPATAECGPMPGAVIHAGAPAQTDSVSMNVTMNGSGPGGISDLMKILRDIENGENKDPHQQDVSKLFGEPHSVDHEEPIMGDIVSHMAGMEGQSDASPLTHEYQVGETVADEEESWGNSAPGSSGHHTHDVEAVTFSGDDMNSKGKSSPLNRVPGSNTLREPTNVSEELVSRLSQMYQAIKEERTEEKDEHGNVTKWKEETPWRKAQNKDGRGKVTNMSDKARRESEKMSKKDVKENTHHDDNESEKIEHLMRKYHWSRQEALEHLHYNEHDPKDYEDMEEDQMAKGGFYNPANDAPAPQGQNPEAPMKGSQASMDNLKAAMAAGPQGTVRPNSLASTNPALAQKYPPGTLENDSAKQLWLNAMMAGKIPKDAPFIPGDWGGKNNPLQQNYTDNPNVRESEDMEESAKWRDPKYKGKLFTQKKGDSDDYDSIDYGYGIKERPKKDPGQKRSTFDRDTVWTDPLDTRSNLPKHHNDPENWGHGSISSKGDSKGKLTADRRKRMKNDIRGSLGQHHTPTLPEQVNESAELNAMLALNKRLNG